MKLYGKGGRAFRCLWMLEEAGVDYEHILTDWAAGDSRTPEFLAINPNGKIPVLIDEDLRLFESLAINYHLARKYAPQMWVANTKDESLAIQWLAWGLGELEGPHDAANRGEHNIDTDRFRISLDALRRVLSHQTYILGSKFTVVDLNTASLLLRPQYRSVIVDDTDLRGWFKACTSRPTLEQAMSKTAS